MSTSEEIEKARNEFEAALQNWVRVSRDDEDGQFFIQDYAVSVASESMAPGLENMTYMNFLTRPGMASYQVVGLLRTALEYWLQAATSRDG